jgi:hypothetical protein
MTPVIGRASGIAIKGRHSASTKVVMHRLQRHGMLSVAGRRVVGKSWGAVASVTVGAREGVVASVTAAGSVIVVGLATVGAREGVVASVTAAGSVIVVGLATVGAREGAVAPGAPVEVERQTRSRESVGAVMCVVRASAAPRAGAAVATAVVAVAPAVVGEASTVAGAAAVAAAGASTVAAAAVAAAGVAVVVGGVDEAGEFCIYILSLTTGALRRT